MIVTMLDGKHDPEATGMIPFWLDEDDPRPAKEQLHQHYAHGGGWHPQLGFKVLKFWKLKYPGDPPLVPFAFMRLRDEMVIMYDYGYVAIFQPTGSFEVCRMD